MNEQDSGYGLVMPFVVCTSEGGPHDDSPFVAGFECGRVDALLQYATPAEYETVVHTENLPQLDLIAMRHDYVLTERGPDDVSPDLVAVRFTRADENASPLAS